MALIAGVQTPAGRIMGHAGAMVRAGENSAKAKIRNLEDAGVTIVNHPSKFGEGMKQILGGRSESTSNVSNFDLTHTHTNMLSSLYLTYLDSRLMQG